MQPARDEFALYHCRAVLEQPYHSNYSTRLTTALYMIDLCAAAGDTAAADQVAASFTAFAMSLGDAETMAVAAMLEAEAAIFTGRVQAAQVWLDTLKIDRVTGVSPFAGWVWGCGLLALGTTAALALASAGLALLVERCCAIHFNSWAVRLYVLLARVHGAQGEMVQGAAALCAAVRLGFAGGCWRDLLEQDPLLDRLLGQAVQDVHQDQAQQAALQELQRLRFRRRASTTQQ